MIVFKRLMTAVALYAISCLVFVLLGAMAKYYLFLFSFGWSLV
jgi:hypothetical protein